MTELPGSSELPRTPPAEVVAKLREEVNFGCPVERCGLPFLTWHHFDPTWRERPHHDVNGMIALCPTHARVADNGLYTNAQLRGLKRDPFVKDRISCEWPWATETMLFLLGRVAVLGTKPLLSLGGRQVLGFVRQAGGGGVPSVRVTLDLLARDGNQLATMTDNVFTAVVGSLSVLEVPPGTRELRLEEKRDEAATKLYLHLRRYQPSDFGGLVDKVMSGEPDLAKRLREIGRSLLDSDGQIPVLKVRGAFGTKEISLNVTAKECELTAHSYDGKPAKLGARIFEAGGSLNLAFENRELIRFG